MKSISDHHEKESRVKRNSYHNVNIILSYLGSVAFAILWLPRWLKYESRWVPECDHDLHTIHAHRRHAQCLPIPYAVLQSFVEAYIPSHLDVRSK
jgi:hypothetical protein